MNSPRAREDRIQSLAKELLLRRCPGYDPKQRRIINGAAVLPEEDEVKACFDLAAYFIDEADERSEAIPLPLPPAAPNLSLNQCP